MPVIEQQGPQPTPIAGLSHSTWAGSADGLQQLSVWRQTLAPGAATPPHRHPCDEVVLCLSGWGELHEDGQPPRRFGPDHTVLLPRGGMHQIFSCGPMPLELIGVFAATPVPVELPDGSALELPWRS
jgi:quercetin dioxygenase-like cupin family protein